ncbi:ATP-binding cassette domain-containing protein [Candidatus Enterococcus courvalinii]|uniref:ABC transporter ATP-binding protein n=1 Tax=Candidatus Enterococcus courvalinii TaxID=2815329 RepID=A0ABS3I2L4_9ENTE|nr:ABC transporter ATP-binding protein [Enterococcus sp. MSG2901]MBO0482950.1 ABC transporter ATP-binding protein [Enterococcus sp. MSG2901]
MSLTIAAVEKQYREKVILKDISLTFEQGKIYGLLGRNGAGKSTLLNIINNRSFASKGQVVLDGKLVTENEAQLTQLYLMSEDNLFPPQLKIKKLFKLTEGFYGDFDWDLANKMAEDFELDLKQKFRKLSTGYRSITKLIMALAVPCDYVFLDEPVLGLDANHRELFYDYLLDTYETRVRTFIISTHLIEEITNLLEEVIILDRGKVIRTDSVEELLSEGKVITGPREEVLNFIQGKKVIGEENLGKSMTAYVNSPVSKELPENIEVAPLSLQDYFVHLTNRKRGH